MPSKRGAPALLAVSMGDPAGIGARGYPEGGGRDGRAPRRARRWSSLATSRRCAGRAPSATACPRRGHGGPATNACARAQGSGGAGTSDGSPPPRSSPARRVSRARRRRIAISWKAARMALAGEADALVTAPINKEWLNRAGHRFPGHSELLAELRRTRLWRMMFAGDQLAARAGNRAHGAGARSRARSRARACSRRSGCWREHLRGRLGIDRAAHRSARLQPARGRERAVRRRGGARDRSGDPPRAARAASTPIGPLAPDTAFIRPAGKFALRRGGRDVSRPGADRAQDPGVRPRGQRDAGLAVRAHLARSWHRV